MTIMYCTRCGTLTTQHEAHQRRRNRDRCGRDNGRLLPISEHPAVRPRQLLHAEFPLHSVIEWDIALDMRPWL